jgi:hypothetical protein
MPESLKFESGESQALAALAFRTVNSICLPFLFVLKRVFFEDSNYWNAD